jgi:hypothetical protein
MTNIATNDGVCDLIRSTEDGAEFYSVSSTGKSGMSQTGLATLAGVTRQSIIKLEEALVTKTPSKWLESFVGETLTLVPEGEVFVNGKSAGNLKIYHSCFCSAAIRHYAFKGNETAQYSMSRFSDMGIEMWIQGITGWVKSEPVGQPYWYRRMMLYREKTKIPVGYFSIFEEIISLIGDLEAQGYVIPTGCIPDISVGKCWAFYLQKVEKINPKNVAKKYKHQYPDWAYPIEAFIYPLELLPKFRVWMEEAYKPLKMFEYFRKKDPAALPSVCRLLGLPEGK